MAISAFALFAVGIALVAYIFGGFAVVGLMHKLLR